MRHRVFVLMGTLAAAIAIAAAPGCGAEAPTAAADLWTPPRTAWGEPDLQGIWDFQSTTPLERPSELAGTQVLSDDEAAEFEQQALHRNSVDRRDGGATADLARAYGEVWYNRNPVRIPAMVQPRAPVPQQVEMRTRMRQV